MAGSKGSGMRDQVSGFRSQASGFRLQVIGNKAQVSGFRSQVSGARCQGTWPRDQGVGLSCNATCNLLPATCCGYLAGRPVACWFRVSRDGARSSSNDLLGDRPGYRRPRSRDGTTAGFGYSASDPVDLDRLIRPGVRSAGNESWGAGRRSGVGVMARQGSLLNRETGRSLDGPQRSTGSAPGFREPQL